MKIIAAFAVGLALAGVLSAAPANAGAARTFVSPTGSDSNNCSLATPCRYLQAALVQTAAGGEIAILGTAGYNGGATVTIDKAISIVNPGGFEAGIAVPSGGTGIVINAGTTDAVSLRGLTLEGGGLGTTGVQFNTGASLTFENCVIRHMASDGIDFVSTTATSALTVSSTVVADNSGIGILLDPAGSSTAVFNHVEANNNVSYGIRVFGSNSAGTNTINATVSESVAAGNGLAGYYNRTQSGSALTNLILFHSVAANNGTGVWAFGTGATISLANSVVNGNANGWQVSNSGVVDSYGDNYIDGNTGNIGSLTSIARQ